MKNPGGLNRSAVLVSLCFLIITFSSIESQTTLYGVVSDDKKFPVPYANISIFGTYEGTVSDDSGKFELTTNLTGKIRLEATSIGMKTGYVEINLNSDRHLVNFELKEEYAALSPAIITAGTFAAGENGKAELFKPRDIGTTAGAPGDMQSTIESLPGIQRVGYTEGLFVRGGSGKESKYIMDGLIFPNPYYSNVPSLKQRGRLDPFLFSGMIFSAGGYSAQYGQALSSVLILNSKGIADSTVTGGGIHNMGGNIFHTHRWKNISLNSGIYYNNLSAYHHLSNSNTIWSKSPENKEIRLVFRYKPGNKGILKVYADASGTTSGIRIKQSEYQQPVGFDIKNCNFIINANYTAYSENNRSSLFTGTSLSHNADRVNFAGRTLAQSDALGQVKILLKHSFTNDLRILAGGEYLISSLYGRADTLKSKVTDHMAALFAEAEATISGKLAIRAGLRSEYSGYSGSYNLTPRTSLAWKFSRASQVSFSYGVFCQLPDKTDMLYNPLGLLYEKAVHYIANYQYQLNDRTLRAEIYHKQYSSLVTEYAPQVNSLSDAGYAKGFELFFRDRTTISNLDWWISYTFTDSKRNTIIKGELITPDYVSKHAISLVGKYWFSRPGFILSVTGNYATPRNFVFQNENGENIDLSIPAYYSVDISLSKPLRLLHRPAMIFCSWQNLTGLDKILGYMRLPEIRDPVSIHRSEKRSFFIGLFISMYNE